MIGSIFVKAHNPFVKNRCFIIAEAGSNFIISNNKQKNHKECFALVDGAIEEGADCIKFQYFKAKEIFNSLTHESSFHHNDRYQSKESQQATY